LNVRTQDRKEIKSLTENRKGLEETVSIGVKFRRSFKLLGRGNKKVSRKGGHAQKENGLGKECWRSLKGVKAQLDAGV